jgi:hypothetical protein
MKFFADASFLYNVYYPEQVFSVAARRLWHREALKVHTTIAAVLEFRLGALWENENESGWRDFQRDKQNGRVMEDGISWEKLFSELEPLVLQFGNEAQPRLLDGLHVLAARQTGATHFLSFDFRSRQRAFARAVGLTVLPERVTGEFSN